jgi:hypothetical protein
MEKVTVWGRSFMRMASHCGLMITTGRKDTGQPSWSQNSFSTRIDHILVQTHVWDNVMQAGVVSQKFGSDHFPLYITLDFRTPTGSMQMEPVAAPYLRWDADRAHEFVAAVQTQSHLWNIFQQATQTDHGHVNIETATTALTDIVWQAASQCNMLVQPGSAARRKVLYIPKEEAQPLKRLMRMYKRTGQPIPPDILHQWRQLVKRSKQAQRRLKGEKLRRYLHSQPRKFWRFSSGKDKIQRDALIPLDQWQSYYKVMFYQEAQAIHPDRVFTPYANGLPTPDHLGLTAEITPQELVQIFMSIPTGKAAGVDRLPHEFLTRACAQVHNGAAQDQAIFYPFAQPLAQLFSIAMQTNYIPGGWKTKCIHPIFKGGNNRRRDNPADYRPVAVSNAYYRIFTAVLQTRLINVAPDIQTSSGQGLFLDQQFGFRPGLSVLHAQLALHTCMDTAISNNEKLVFIKLDIHKAYDTVNRSVLWNKLCHLGIPWQFVRLLQSLYKDAHYVVFANGQHSASFPTNIGLQQGCPLSPILYNLYVRDALHNIQRACSDIGVTLADGTTSALVNYADDIVGTIIGLKNIGKFLAVVEQELGLIHQQISRDKSRILVIMKHPRGIPLNICGVPVYKELKILGVIFYRNGNLGGNVAVRAKATETTTNAIHVKSRGMGCSKDPVVMLHLLNAQVRPTLLFGDVIWGPHEIHRTLVLVRDPMKYPLQVSFNVLLRSALGVAHSTGTWMCLMLAGHLPVVDYIILDFCRFWNTLLSLTQDNAFLAACLATQQELLSQGHTSWLSLWNEVLHRLIPEVAGGCLLDGEVVDIDDAKESLIFSHTDLLHSYGDPLAPQCSHHCTSMHFQQLNLAPEWGKQPAHIKWTLPSHVRQSWMNFLVANAPIPLRADRFQRVPFQQRMCTKCDLHALGDEHHVLLECPATQLARDKYSTCLTFQHPDMKQFLEANKQEHRCAWFVHEAMDFYMKAGRGDC